MKYEHWQIPAAPEDAIKTLMDAGYPYLVSSVLAARGVTTSEQAAEALEREKTLAHSPFLMKDMDKAVARISKALENGEKLAVFGDYDVDGITSTCLLTDYLRSRGADVTMHIPRRIEEGYGLGCDAIRALSESGVTLIVTVDCGITGVDETAYAATLGVEEKLTAMRVVNDVEAGFKMSEAVQIDEPRAIVWVHADGRGVHDDLRVRVTIQIVVVVLPLAGDDGHAARAHLLEHGTDRRGGAAGAEHERLFAIDLNAARPDHTGKAVGIGVVAVQRAVLAPDQHVHTLEFLRNG